MQFGPCTYLVATEIPVDLTPKLNLFIIVAVTGIPPSPPQLSQFKNQFHPYE